MSKLKAAAEQGSSTRRSPGESIGDADTTDVRRIRVSVAITADTHRACKVTAAEYGLSLQKLFEAWANALADGDEHLRSIASSVDRY